jgi:hypothetical protein
MLIIRFIFNFILFGLLFYFIWTFFPDAFQTLVTWISKIADLLVDLGRWVVSWVQDITKRPPEAPTTPTPRPSSLMTIFQFYNT